MRSAIDILWAWTGNDRSGDAIGFGWHTSYPFVLNGKGDTSRWYLSQSWFQSGSNSRKNRLIFKIPGSPNRHKARRFNGTMSLRVKIIGGKRWSCQRLNFVRGKRWEVFSCYPLPFRHRSHEFPGSLPRICPWMRTSMQVLTQFLFLIWRNSIVLFCLRYDTPKYSRLPLPSFTCHNCRNHSSSAAWTYLALMSFHCRPLFMLSQIFSELWSNALCQVSPTIPLVSNFLVERTSGLRKRWRRRWTTWCRCFGRRCCVVD